MPDPRFLNDPTSGVRAFGYGVPGVSADTLASTSAELARLGVSCAQWYGLTPGQKLQLLTTRGNLSYRYNLQLASAAIASIDSLCAAQVAATAAAPVAVTARPLTTADFYAPAPVPAPQVAAQLSLIPVPVAQPIPVLEVKNVKPAGQALAASVSIPWWLIIAGLGVGAYVVYRRQSRRSRRSR